MDLVYYNKYMSYNDNKDYICFDGKLFNMKHVYYIDCNDKTCTMSNAHFIGKLSSPKEKVFRCSINDYLVYAGDKNKHIKET